MHMRRSVHVESRQVQPIYDFSVPVTIITAEDIYL